LFTHIIRLKHTYIRRKYPSAANCRQFQDSSAVNCSWFLSFSVVNCRGNVSSDETATWSPYTLFHHHLFSLFHLNTKIQYFLHQILPQNHWCINPRRYQHTFDVKKQVLLLLIGLFFVVLCVFSVCLREWLSWGDRQLTAKACMGNSAVNYQSYFGS